MNLRNRIRYLERAATAAGCCPACRDRAGYGLRRYRRDSPARPPFSWIPRATRPARAPLAAGDPTCGKWLKSWSAIVGKPNCF